MTSAGIRRAVSLTVTALGVTAMAYIAWRTNLASTLASLERAGLTGLAMIFASTGSVLFLQTVGWLVMMRAEGIPVSLRHAGESMTVGFMVSYLTPSMYLGGEPVRAMIIARRYGVQHRRVMGTIVVHKFAEFFGFLVALAVSVSATAWLVDLPAGVRSALWGGLGGFALIFLAATAAVVTNRRPLERFCRGCSRVTGRTAFWDRVAERIAGMESTMSSAFREHRAATLLGGFLTSAPIAIVYCKPMLFFLAHDGSNPLGFPELSLTFALSQMILAVQFTPGGIGIFEGGQVAIYTLIGVRPAVAMAYTALLRAEEATLCLAGAWLAIRFGLTAWGGERSGGAHGAG